MNIKILLPVPRIYIRPLNCSWKTFSNNMPYSIFQTGGACRRHDKDINADLVLVGTSERTTKLRTPKHSRKDNITLGVRETEWDSVDWINLAHDKNKWRVLVDTAMNHRVPNKGQNFLIHRETVSISRTRLREVT